MVCKYFPLASGMLLILGGSAFAQANLDELPSLLPGRTVAQNALWIENAPACDLYRANESWWPKSTGRPPSP